MIFFAVSLPDIVLWKIYSQLFCSALGPYCHDPIHYSMIRLSRLVRSYYTVNLYQASDYYISYKLSVLISYPTPHNPGAHRRTGNTDIQKTFRFIQLFRHEQFSMRQLKNDVALLQLEPPVLVSSKVNTVCLPSSGSRAPAGSRCYITGEQNF